MTLTDDSLMPWGKYKNLPMFKVPADYLLFMYDQNKCSKDVKDYIEDSFDILKKECLLMGIHKFKNLKLKA